MSYPRCDVPEHDDLEARYLGLIETVMTYGDRNVIEAVREFLSERGAR